MLVVFGTLSVERLGDLGLQLANGRVTRDENCERIRLDRRIVAHLRDNLDLELSQVHLNGVFLWRFVFLCWGIFVFASHGDVLRL